jgi:DNA-binding phage protein
MGKPAIATTATPRRKPARDPVVRLDEALTRNDQRAFMNALREIVKERGGFAMVARESSLNRTSLYQMVSARRDIRLSTLIALLPSLGLTLSVTDSRKTREDIEA